MVITLNKLLVPKQIIYSSNLIDSVIDLIEDLIQ